MRIKFEVIKDGESIYSMDFPVDKPDQFGEFSRVALDDFRTRIPTVSLLDDDVQMKWSKA